MINAVIKAPAGRELFLWYALDPYVTSGLTVGFAREEERRYVAAGR